MRLIALTALLFTFAGSAATAETFTVGDWEGRVRRDGTSGRFSRCTIEASYKSGITLTFGLTRFYNLEIWLRHDEWQLEEGPAYQVIYWVDDGIRHRGVAKVQATRLARIDIDSPDVLFDALKRGRRLYVQTGTDTKVFRLDGTFRALDRLWHCVEEHTRFASPPPIPQGRNPFTATPVHPGVPQTANPLAPAPRGTTAEDLAEFGRWNTRAQELANGLYDVAIRLDEVDALGQRFIEGEIASAIAQSRGNRLISAIRRELSELSRQVNALEPFKALSQKERNLSANTLRYLHTLSEQIDGLIVDSQKALAAALRGDEKTYSRLYVKTIDRWMMMLSAENVAVDIYNASLDEIYPQYSLNLAIKHGNETIVSILNYIREVAAGRTPSLLFKYTAERSLESMTSQIQQGRQKIKPLQISIRQDPGATAERLKLLGSALETYYDSFKIEERIAGVLLIASHTTFGAQSSSQIASDEALAMFEKIGAAISELAEERSTLQLKRSKLISQFR
jgi:hypothetical protein